MIEADPQTGVCHGIVDDEDPESAGFIIVSLAEASLRMVYTDLRARWFFTGRSLVGAPLGTLFEATQDPGAYARLRTCLLEGHAVSLRVRTRDRDGAPRSAMMRVQPLAGGDAVEPWALCIVDLIDAAGSTDEAPQRWGEHGAGGRGGGAELGDVLDMLSSRLRLLLPGQVDVVIRRLPDALWVGVAAAALEEVVTGLLALGRPRDPWRYTVRLEAQACGRAEARLSFVLDDDQHGPLAPADLPTRLVQRLEELALRLEPADAFAPARGFALVMPRLAAA